jgi:hypothetical protein
MCAPCAAQQSARACRASTRTRALCSKQPKTQGQAATHTPTTRSHCFLLVVNVDGALRHGHAAWYERPQACCPPRKEACRVTCSCTQACRRAPCCPSRPPAAHPCLLLTSSRGPPEARARQNALCPSACGPRLVAASCQRAAPQWALSPRRWGRRRHSRRHRRRLRGRAQHGAAATHQLPGRHSLAQPCRATTAHDAELAQYAWAPPA